MNLGLYSYIGASVAYGFFTFLLLTSWHASLQGKLLFSVVVTGFIWSVLAADVANENADWVQAYQISEIARYITWYLFLLMLFNVSVKHGSSYQKFLKWALPLSITFAGVLLFCEMIIYPPLSAIVVTGHVVMALIGLAIIEQLYRNTAAQHRWAMKYLFFGAGAIFAFDFYLYADTLLFRGVDQELWGTRGIVHFVAVPLLAVSAVRSKSWSLNIFVSRDIILNTTAIVGGGMYLLIIAGAGYYLREFGGTWGRIGQVLFIALAIVLLFTIISSSHLRARIKVFLAKHFYKNRYDYRVEWLRLTEELDDTSNDYSSHKSVIQALAQIVDARSGLLWIDDEHTGYRNVAVWHAKQIDRVEPNSGSLVKFLENRDFIININEVELCSDEYENLVLPDWWVEVEKPWLIVPLHGNESLSGFIVLTNPLVARSINWEDRDLIITAAKQISNYLTILTTSFALAEAKQFEVFTRLSAYMVHDLKNIASELEMVSRNAKKHMNNPEFIQDTFATVANAAGDIQRLLVQLKNKQANVDKISNINLTELVQQVVDNKQGQRPKPHFNYLNENFYVEAEKDRLVNVLAHLIDNAQQATDDNGFVDVMISNKQAMHIIEIKDSGHGMDDGFIRERLFKPFDTTKGNAGMGIGMYESRDFAQQLGGDIHVQSAVGKGSTISISIPAGAAPG